MVDLLKVDGEVAAPSAWHVGSGALVVISAKATIVATGGSRSSTAATAPPPTWAATAMRLPAPARRWSTWSSCSSSRSGIWRRLIGMDPIMWDPFRYKLGGRLLNKDMQEFTDRYGVAEDGKYVITRDLGTYAIIKEVEAGLRLAARRRLSELPARAGGEAARGVRPVIDRLPSNGIDLTKMPVEVAPIAHYHMAASRPT